MRPKLGAASATRLSCIRNPASDTVLTITTTHEPATDLGFLLGLPVDPRL
jgi:hypothetical protein